MSVALSEQEAHWREFLISLKDRGLHGIELFISDAHEGLKAARKAVFPSVPWQRCQFHVQQNAQKYVPRQSMKREVAEAIRGVFNALNRQEAERQLDLLIEAYQEKAPKLAEWAAEAIPEALTAFASPKPSAAHPNQQHGRALEQGTQAPNTPWRRCSRMKTAA